MRRSAVDKITVSIVNYNAGNFLLDCLESLEKIKDEAETDIFVVDNASSDNSIELAKKEFGNVKYILNEKNVGFGAANNQVLKNLKTDYALILNPDVVLGNGVLSEMLKFM